MIGGGAPAGAVETPLHSEFDVCYADEISIRLYSVTPSASLAKLKASMIDKLVAIKGTVIRMSVVRPVAKQMAFLCNACGQHTIVLCNDGRFESASKCSTKNCRGSSLQLDRLHPGTITIDLQRIR